jgi:hypothetical protein
MPANLTSDYLAAEQAYQRAETHQEKIAALEQMLGTLSATAAPVTTTSARAACLSHGVWMTGSASSFRKAGKIPMPSAPPTA